MKFDTWLHKTCIKVLRLDMRTSMISCGAITHSAKETRQPNVQWGWGLEATWKVGGGWGLWTKSENGGGLGNIGGFIK